MLNEKLAKLGLQIDDASDNADIEMLEQSLAECDLLIEEMDSYNCSILYFYKANCYSAIRTIEKQFQDDTWDWHQEKRILEILNLRQAIKEDGFEQLEDLMKCKILTNLANSLSSLGRVIEANKYYERALAQIDNFAMGIGNKAIGLFHYAQHLYDGGHAGAFFFYINKELSRFDTESLLWDCGIQKDALTAFHKYKKYTDGILNDIQFNHNFDFNNFSLGEGEDEQDYREWCLKNKLFINPLNDLLQAKIAATDIFHLPDHIYNINEDPRFPKYFNILKQELITSRYMLYEFGAMQLDHLSDNDVFLENGLDGVEFGYRNELLKNSLRISYSIFDKIALFLNDYMKVGLKVDGLNFRNIWGKYQNKKLELFPCFANNDNWPLRGLYFLSKDLYSPNFKDVAEPEAREVHEIRNMAEHRYLGIQEYAAQVDNTDYMKYITVDDLHSKALKMLSLAREGLIYLSLAMHVEESKHDEDDSELLAVLQSHSL